MSIRMNRLARRSALSLALGMCFAGGVQAQNVTGSIYGDVGAGGGSVVIQNMDTGASFNIAPDANGRYTASTLPAGRYKVTLQRDGAEVTARENVQVLVGRGTEVGFAGVAEGATAGDAVTLEGMTVYGQGLHQIDVSQIESKMVITKAELDRLPVARNITAISLLAPGVVEGDSRYPQAPTVSGSSASENAYYINGYPVKNPLSNVGYTQLPFNGVDQVQISTGGYGVEYGRATGGVVNIITARGSNEWKAGGQVIWRPEDIAGNPRNIYYSQENERSGLEWGNAGQIYQYRKENKSQTLTTSAYIGGPIIRDRLFFYAAAEMIKQEGQGTRTFASSATAVNTGRAVGWDDYTIRTPRWLGKLDWYITDNHHLELTAFSDRNKRTDDYYGFDYVDFSHNDVVGGGLYTDDKTDTYVANYTGYLTDNFTVAAMYGESKVDHIFQPSGYDPACPTITINAGGAVPGLNYGSCQTTTGALQRSPSYDETTARRLDLEYRLGDHTLKGGYDYTDATTDNEVQNIPGGFSWTYSRFDNPNEPVYPRDGVGSPASGGGYGTQGYFVQRVLSSFASTSSVEQEAFYLKDLWQVSDNVLLELGLRSESFTNYNSGGEAFVEKSNQLAPRFGASWDVHGDSSLKLFAYAGRYHLALPNYISRRMADGAINTNEAFTYTGVDPTTGAPTGLNSLGPVYSANNEFGQPKDPRTIAPTGLKSHAQDTFAVGMEQKWRDFNIGAKFTYTNLISAIDDFCDGRQGYAWALENGYTEDQAQGLSDHLGGCVMLNPGEDNTYLWDMEGDGDYERVDLTADELGFPKLKRNYYALDLFFERPFDGKWYARVDYTFAKNWGNMEGQLNSDLGQADVSSTVTSDYPELAEHSSGYLPNHRRHQFRAHGYYQFADEWTGSVNVVWMSGRPRNCLGAYPNEDTDSPNYGSFHFYCDGQPAPRGTYGKLPALYRWDFGLQYRPNWAKGLQFGANLYNAFNRQSVQNITENYNLGTSVDTVSANWNRVISYTTPRYLELSVRYDWGSSD